MNTYTTHREAPALTLEILQKAERSIPPCPLEAFANKHGFSLDGGDYMIVPKDMSDKIPERKGVVFSRFADAIYLAKDDAIYLGIYSKDKSKKGK